MSDQRKASEATSNSAAGQSGPRKGSGSREMAGPAKPIPDAAARALAEAAERRAAASKQVIEKPKELQGRDGPEPTRYGDWENSGIASDF